MPEDENNNGTPETGKDVEELKASIAALKEQQEKLIAELKAKEPEKPEKTDHFAEYAKSFFPSR